MSNEETKNEVVQIARCAVCGSDSVYYDAYVGVNDPTDIRTFDDVFCDECSGEASVVWTADEISSEISVTITLTKEECNALWYFWNISSELTENLNETGIDLLDVLSNLACASIGPAKDKWGESLSQLEEESEHHQL